MKKMLLLSGLAIVLALPLSSFTSEKQTVKRSNLQTKKKHLIFKKNFAIIEFGDFIANSGPDPDIIYAVYGESGTTNISYLKNVYTQNAPQSYTVNSFNGSYIDIEGIDENGIPFHYQGYLVWA